MNMIVQYCPLCGSDQSNLFDRREFRSKMVSNRICSNCGLVYQSPRMSEGELKKFYEHEYRQLYQGNEGPNPKDLAVQKSRAGSLMEFSRGKLTDCSRHLDIGCSAGLLLQRFQEAYQCQSIGTEPGSAYRSYAQEHGLRVYASLDELATTGEPQFDLISMAHVLEHIGDPVTYLKSLRENLLDTDGYLLVEVPNLYAHESFEVAHLISFSAHTFTQTLQKAGFDIIALEQHGRPRSEILPLYLTALACSPSNLDTFHLRQERGVRRKRQMGMLRRRLLTRLAPRRAWLPIQ
jgi:2-polyprenyl-3-methyl-5-hydroxy-6-metoxy-1,4-benzoquinol methylase